MTLHRTMLRAAGAIAATLLGLSGCGGAGTDFSSPSFSVGGSISGLGASRSVGLALNGLPGPAITQNGSFQLESTLSLNSAYAVTVATQPVGQVCTVGNATGAGITSNVGNLRVSCSDLTYTVSGTVSGLAPALALGLVNNASDNLTVDANGALTFSQPVNHNGSYAVTVGTQPVGQICTVSNGTGTGVTANISSLAVTCAAQTFTVSGSVSGLAAASQVTLMNNGADPVIVSADGSFTFAAPVNYNGSYGVTVNQQPTGQICTVSNGAGGGITANVSNVAITCGVQTFTVSGTVSGLASTAQVTLMNNGADPLVVSSDSSFTFSVPVNFNGAYSVTVNQQPTGHTCTVTHDSGTASTDVTNVAVSCVSAAPLSYLTPGTYSWTAPVGITSVNYLVVAGGGGGGNGYDTVGGGGGGGGMVLAGTAAVVPGTVYQVTVGAGGAGGANLRSNVNGAAGGDSGFGAVLALGGSGGHGSRSAASGVGIAGAAANGTSSASTAGNGGGSAATAVQGSGGGGGGSAGNGTHGTAGTGGTGGAGTSASLGGVSGTFGLGGNGARGNSPVVGASAAANTGNGGGAGSNRSSSSNPGGAGGSGFVVLTW